MARILYIDESSGIGGAEAYLKMVAGHFAGGHRVTVIHRDDAAHGEFYSGINAGTVRVPVGDYTGPTALFLKYLTEFRRIRPDLLHMNLPAPNFCRVAAIAGKTAGIPVLMATSHLPNLRFPRSLMGKLAGKGAWDRVVRRSVLSCTDLTIVVSRASAVSFLADCPAGKGKVACIYNGVDFDRFRRMNVGEAERSRREMKIPDGSLVITVIGSLVRQKGHGTLIDAFARVAGEYRDALILVVGDGPLRKELEERAAGAGISGKVVFTGWRDDVPALLAISDISVNCSLYEGLPYTILESMAAGVPVAASAVDGNVEAVSDGETGLLFPAHDAEGLAAVLRRLMGDKPLRLGLAERAAKTVRERFSMDAMMGATADAYREHLRRRGVPWQ